MNYLSFLKTTIPTVFSIFIFIYGFSTLFGPIPLSITSTTTSKNDLFTVEGVGEASGIPDTAMLTLGITKQAATVKEAQNQVNAVSSKIANGLKSLGVKVTNIKTTNYSVYPNYDYFNGAQRITSYTVSQNLEVKLQPIEQANNAIDLATSAGANIVSGVTFVFDDAMSEKLEQQARKKAIENAKNKARELAKLSGIRLGKVVNVTESPLKQPEPIFALEARSANSKESEPTQISPGENTVHITVNISYETL